MSTARDLIAAQLRTDSPETIVSGFPTAGPENIPRGKTVVQLYRTEFEPISSGTLLKHTFELVVMVSSQGTEHAELALEEALDTVLLSLERFQGLTYSTVTRSVVGNFNAYVITASTNTTNHYKNIVREEQKVA